MFEALAAYDKVINEVLEESPVLSLEKYLKDNNIITTGELTQLIIKLTKCWKKYKKYSVDVGIIIIDKESYEKEIIYNHDFDYEIKNIIQENRYKSYIYYINAKCEIIEIKGNEEPLTIEKSGAISKELQKIFLHLGVRGIDVLINGILYQAENFMSSYRDLLETDRLKSISEYKDLINGFFISCVQYDPLKRYFILKQDLPKECRELIEKYPKLLRNKPEDFFHMDFIKYLKDHCNDTVIKEYKTATGDRYDILVLTSNEDIYVFEIKWLGISITTGMKIFSNYNTGERAVEGAYQLMDYVENADTYKDYFSEYPIYCAVLLTFDAREEDSDINFPQEVIGRANVDLTQRLFIHKEKIPASSVYHSK